MNKFKTGIGVMSGTSLDGIDLAWCQFDEFSIGKWNFSIIKADTFPYNPSLKNRLANATELSALEYCKLNVELGEVIAAHLNNFIGDDNKPDFIASHGHTVFHQPNEGLTTQIGSGAIIAARTGITTICDFRTLDVALRGQGAPLVPIGDELLFGQYDACLNLGGFSNISFRQNNKRIAFDISPCNMALNNLSNRLGLAYDIDGDIARSGNILYPMLEELNLLEYYTKPAPKSLGKEWFDEQISPIICSYTKLYPIKDCLRTLVEHISEQIANAIPTDKQNIFITGGGAFNLFLLERIKNKWPHQIVIPDRTTINYKEAIIFAFLGYLRLLDKSNCLSSVTGATIDNCGGCIWKS